MKTRTPRKSPLSSASAWWAVPAAFLATLLEVPHLILCVNKMDLVDYDEAAFEAIAEEFRAFATKLRVPDLAVIPVSALKGDNVVTRSENMPWYEGSSLLHHLENVHVASDRNLIDARFPVQYVIRPQSDAWHDYRGYAGQVAGGVFKKGDEVEAVRRVIRTGREEVRVPELARISPRPVTSGSRPVSPCSEPPTKEET